MKHYFRSRHGFPLSRLSVLTLAAILALELVARPADAQTGKIKPDANTVALWNLGEMKDGMVKDEGGSQMDMIHKVDVDELNRPEVVDEKFGKVAYFPGRAAMIAVPHQVIKTPKEVTIEAWIRLDKNVSDLRRGIFEYAAHGEAGFRMNVQANDRLVWTIQNGSGEEGPQTSAPLPLDRWIHVAGTFDGEFMRIYVDGQLSGETRSPGGIPQGAGKPFIGLISAGGPPYFMGSIRAIRISDVAKRSFPDRR